MLGPESAHSPNAEDLNALYWVMLAIAAVLALAANAALVALVVRHRAVRGRSARRVRSRGRAQFIVAGGLTAIAIVIFAAGVIVTHSASKLDSAGADGLQASRPLTAQRTLDVPSGDPQPLKITAVGQQWIWRYEYPAPAADQSSSPNPSAPAGTGASASFPQTFSYYELVVPVDTTVLLTLDSTDVLHRWWVPGLGAKADAIPGTLNQTWFRADEEGVYDGASYAFSGAGYPAMRTRVRVVDVPQYQQWLAEQAQGIQKGQAFVQAQLAEGGALVDNSEGDEAPGGSE
ncbi:MAG: cytochrome c oxidase subunit II [Solirubrobacterales bacterium]|nr:cytochrome c oxidase subunit II [Solirubrobacterales bacterium]